MKIICDKHALIAAVGNVQRAVSGRSSVSVLDGILLRAGRDVLTLVGYDLELGIVTDIEAQVTVNGQIVINARLFGDIVRKLPGETVKIETDERFQVSITSDEASFTIMGIDAAEYPDVPTVTDGEEIALPENVLKSMIRQTLFAVAQTDIRPVHTGVQFTVADHKLRLVAVDGSRLAIRCEEVDCDLDTSFVVPGKTLNELLKLLGDEDQIATLRVGQQHILTEVAGYSVISRLLEGEFLAYQKAIPPQVGTELRVNTRALTEGVERASLVINDRVKSPLVCRFHEDGVTVSCSTPLGTSKDKIAVESMQGNPEEMGFNSRFLLDALKNAETDEVRIQLCGAVSPMKIVPMEGESFLFLVLPVRLKA
ncbi:MAG: DNA polymerase III subunit beta [Acutalibacteraceae bacterium]|jgi:DNA polymerase-3 subunit beta